MRLTAAQRWSWLAHLFKAATQQHHRDLIPLFAPHLPRDGVVIDVGAHGGQFSKLFARMAPEGRVYAFEPSDYALSVLRPALAWSGLSRRVQVVARGLSDAPGELTLRTPLKPGGAVRYGVAHLGGEAETNEAVEQQVRLTTLDAFARDAGLTRLDLIKIDVEGWEAHALAGGRDTLLRFRPAIYAEVIADSLARAGRTPGHIWALLEPLGYTARLGRDPVSAYAGPGDYLFTVRR